MDAAKRTCSVPDCELPVSARGWCCAHYTRWRTNGDPQEHIPLRYRRNKNPATNFWKKVDRRGPDECWPWLAGQCIGYGRFVDRGVTVWAHRFSYELCVGPIPEGLVIDHLCCNTRCVNPAHLEPVTSRENTLRYLSIRYSELGVEP